AKDELRPGTRRPGTLASALSSSSVMPSLRYSSALSALMFTNGSTATDFWPLAPPATREAFEVGRAEGDGLTRCDSHQLPAANNAATSTAPAVKRAGPDREGSSGRARTEAALSRVSCNARRISAAEAYRCAQSGWQALMMTAFNRRNSPPVRSTRVVESSGKNAGSRPVLIT